MFALLAITTRRAQAAPEVQLGWLNQLDAQSCPDQAWAEQRLAERLGRSPHSEVPRGLVAALTLSQGERGLTLTLRTTSDEQSGERVLEGHDCRALVDAALLIVALAAEQARELTQSNEAGPREPVEAPPRPAAPPPAAPPPSAQRGQLSLRLEGVVERGLLDRVAFGPQLAFGYQRGIYWLELAGLWLAPRQMRGPEGSGAVEVSLWTGRALGCVLWGQRRVTGGPCLGLELGQVRARGLGDDATTGKRDYSLWAATALGGRLVVQLIPRLALVLGSELLVGLRRPRFVTSDADTQTRTIAHESWAVQLRGSAGLQLRF